ncbi:hypothetical protein FQR65_LT04073 [Abscondita terminalis]|nr:hypothetical protein FQR65_LT04073 [Abscondita terminalis]
MFHVLTLYLQLIKKVLITFFFSIYLAVITEPQSCEINNLEDTIRNNSQSDEIYSCCKETRKLVLQVLTRLELVSQEVKFLTETVQRCNSRSEPYTETKMDEFLLRNTTDLMDFNKRLEEEDFFEIMVNRQT